jgi:hypothetical protein
VNRHQQSTLEYIFTISLVAMVGIIASMLYMHSASSTQIGKQNVILNAEYFVSGNGQPICDPNNPIQAYYPQAGESCLVFVTKEPLPSWANYAQAQIANNPNIISNDRYMGVIQAKQNAFLSDSSQTTQFLYVPYDNVDHFVYLGKVNNYYEYMMLTGGIRPIIDSFNLVDFGLEEFSPNIASHAGPVSTTEILPLEENLIVPVITTNSTVGPIPIEGSYSEVLLSNNFETNPITNPTPPENVNPTGAYYKYAIPIHINSWRNYTNWNLANPDWRSIPKVDVSSRFVKITVPYYSQMNTKNGRCTGITLVANQPYMGNIPFAIAECNPNSQTITLIARNITTNGYKWNDGYILFGPSTNTSIESSKNQDLLTNNYSVYSNPNIAPIVINITSNYYVEFQNPLNLKTYFSFPPYGMIISEDTNSGTTSVYYNDGYGGKELFTSIQSTPKLFYVAFGNVNGAGASVVTNHLDVLAWECTYSQYEPSCSGMYSWTDSPYGPYTKCCIPSSPVASNYYIHLNVSSNTAYVYVPMTINYTLGPSQPNPFIQ